MAAAGFNVVGAALFAFPESLGWLFGLPAAPPLYTNLTALFVVLFAASYAWLAAQPQLDRSLLALGAIGKCLAFVLFAALWLAGEVSLLFFLVSFGELAFALIFASWLRR